jgi:hypothetical protein
MASHYLLGNGKRHRIPSPKGLRKIKRISFETFLSLKELLKRFNQPVALKHRGRFNKPLVANKKRYAGIQISGCAYQPSKISDAYDSTFWQWRRVISWERYINDPLEKIKRGTM